MKNIHSISIAIILLVMSFSSMTAHANVFRVNNNPAYNQYIGQKVFSDLDSAVHDPMVVPGDTLYVEASATPYNSVTIIKKITIIGTGYFLNLNLNLQKNSIAATVLNFNFAAGSSESTLSGLRIADNTFPNIYFNAVPLHDITITNCYIQGGIGFQNTTPVAYNNIVIKKNYLGGIGVPTFPGPVTGLEIRNNRFGDVVSIPANYSGSVSQNVFESGVHIDGIDFFNNILTVNNFPQFTNNTSANVHHNVFSFQPTWLTGGNNQFNVAPTTIFPTVGSIDVKLDPYPATNCPQCYMGLGGLEVGVYGGNDPYVKSGIPGIPTIYLLQAQPTGFSGGVVNTTVSTRSNN